MVDRCLQWTVSIVRVNDPAYIRTELDCFVSAKNELLEAILGLYDRGILVIFHAVAKSEQKILTTSPTSSHRSTSRARATCPALLSRAPLPN